jgi:homoserine kinase
VRVFAPGGIGNIGPGLDMLGCAVTGLGDVVELEWSDEQHIDHFHLADPGHPDLSSDPTRHAAAIAALGVLHAQPVRPTRGLVMRVTKGLPLAGGQGGSAASAVAGAFAMNTLLVVSGLSLWVSLHYSLTRSPWLMIKLVALVGYFISGHWSMGKARFHQLGYVIALACMGIVMLVSITRQGF